MSYILELAQKTKQAQKDIAKATIEQKQKLLYAIADSLIANIEQILNANEIDLSHAKDNNISETMQDRLRLTTQRIEAMANGVRKVAMLPDPINEVIEGRTLANGLEIKKIRVPLGVIGIIYESRPNVTVDAAALCLKASNAVVLRGGKEAIHTNIALAKVMKNAIANQGFHPDIVSIVEDTSREVSTQMMQLNGVIDVLIPRGGAGLIQAVVKNATIPVIETGVGNCHVYIDNEADLQMGAQIVYNAKVSRPSVCNACESLLVHKDVANKFLPMVKALLDQNNVKLLGCDKTKHILGDCVIPATDEDYATEFLDYILSIKVVDSLNEAITHIQTYTTHHSEAIVTNNIRNANQFTSEIDAAAVYVNASTRFTDGEEFGLGAEIGISTQKLHARGPMGLKELTSMKYIIIGNGNVR
ncbi:glutamate-5-semialdehyde dehydrogenase [Paludicola sp. MB14-C6]|uniref:glutamate-5-semialdehyde dehydrogenase n=1 Tax=Paludihabitans sp. MB14-C6 TaxID=3070656 RepID=UPI0027DDA19E|nr:glutamate-5-semialdehyde dehydrogenase [Paludicola sp. MB14-C6]WMJ23927.1 glutamate-5-semialdehyde dehydrogenase [Paludicola sp. MB14-C6]